MGDDHSYYLVDGPWEAGSVVAAEGFGCKGVEETRSLALELLKRISQGDRIGFPNLLCGGGCCAYTGVPYGGAFMNTGGLCPW